MVGTTTPRNDDPRLTLTCTILSSGSLSSHIDLAGYRLAAVGVSTAWSSAPITFLSGDDTVTLRSLFSDGGEVSFSTSSVKASRDLVPSSSMSGALAARRYIQLRSGPSSGAVNQAAERTLSLVCLPLSVGG